MILFNNPFMYRMIRIRARTTLEETLKTVDIISLTPTSEHKHADQARPKEARCGGLNTTERLLAACLVIGPYALTWFAAWLYWRTHQ